MTNQETAAMTGSIAGDAEIILNGHTRPVSIPLIEVVDVDLQPINQTDIPKERLAPKPEIREFRPYPVSQWPEYEMNPNTIQPRNPLPPVIGLYRGLGSVSGGSVPSGYEDSF